MSEYIVEYSSYEFTDGSGKVSLPINFKEEITRCRDCEYSHESESDALYCHGYLTEPWDYYNDAPNMSKKIKPDGFCAWGERRDV